MPDIATDPNDTSLRISIQKDDDDEPPRYHEDKLVNWPKPSSDIMKDGHYGHDELKPGHRRRVEFLADYVILGMFVHTGKYTFTAEAKLPDGRVLFCFQPSVFLKGDSA